MLVLLVLLTMSSSQHLMSFLEKEAYCERRIYYPLSTKKCNLQIVNMQKGDV